MVSARLSSGKTHTSRAESNEAPALVPRLMALINTFSKKKIPICGGVRFHIFALRNINGALLAICPILLIAFFTNESSWVMTKRHGKWPGRKTPLHGESMWVLYLFFSALLAGRYECEKIGSEIVKRVQTLIFEEGLSPRSSKEDSA